MIRKPAIPSYCNFSAVKSNKENEKLNCTMDLAWIQFLLGNCQVSENWSKAHQLITSLKDQTLFKSNPVGFSERFLTQDGCWVQWQRDNPCSVNISLHLFEIRPMSFNLQRWGRPHFFGGGGSKGISFRKDHNTNREYYTNFRSQSGKAIKLNARQNLTEKFRKILQYIIAWF